MTRPVGDGLPETLPEWIRFNGLTHLKIKLNGDDLGWDVERVLRIDGAAARTQKERGVSHWFYSLDFNERCRNVDYLLEFLRRVKERTPAGFERIQYVEQPTARDLKAQRANVMHEAAKLRPVVIDESLIDLESLQLAREMGYTGAALKACKGQTQSLLMAAAAKKYGMFLCVQDLTCAGASLIHSAGLAAHVPGVAAIEANGRQYCPAANVAWEERYPGTVPRHRRDDGNGRADGAGTRDRHGRGGKQEGELLSWPRRRETPVGSSSQVSSAAVSRRAAGPLNVRAAHAAQRSKRPTAANRLLRCAACAAWTSAACAARTSTRLILYQGGLLPPPKGSPGLPPAAGVSLFSVSATRSV